MHAATVTSSTNFPSLVTASDDPYTKLYAKSVFSNLFLSRDSLPFATFCRFIFRLDLIFLPVGKLEKINTLKEKEIR